ncbi:MAG: zinc ribbon domain-containing protein [Caldiserica bacterium]|nr:zinc ribbon domain-containing protein [Caldisericota bacterium]
MFCKNCGKEIAEGSQFCPFCGAKPSEVRTARRSHSVATGSLLGTLVLIVASLLGIVSLVSLIGSLSASSKLNGTVNSIVAMLSSMGLDTSSDATASQIVQYARTAMASMSKFVVFAGITFFLILLLMGLIAVLVVAIDRKVSSATKSTNP